MAQPQTDVDMADTVVYFAQGRERDILVQLWREGKITEGDVQLASQALGIIEDD